MSDDELAGEELCLDTVEVSPLLQEGELRVFDNDSAVAWVPEQKRLGRQSADHQVISPRFTLRIAGRNVMFLMMLQPARTQNRRGIVRAAFKNTQQRQVQLKCLEDLESFDGVSVQVTFTVGSEQRKVMYDFQQTVCEPMGNKNLWDIMPKRGEMLAIEVRVAAGPARW